MKVMLKRTLLIALLALTMLGLLAIGVGAAAMEGTFDDDAAAITAGAVAKITVDETTAYYATAEDAIAAAQDGDTIVLLANVELTAPVIIDKAVTFSGDYTVTSSAATSFVVSGNLTLNCNNVNNYATGSLVTLVNGASVSINGTAEAYKLLSGYDASLHTVTTTVESVTTALNNTGLALVKTGDTWTVMTDAPEAAIDGWNYVTVEDAFAAGGVVTLLRDVTVEDTVNVTGALTVAGNYTLTSTAATAFKLAEGASLAINAKLSAADVLDATGAWAVTTTDKAVADQLNAEGYSLLLSEGVYTVTSNNPEVAVDGWNVATLKYALDNAAHGQTVVLLRDITAAENEMNILKNITLDGNGKTLTNTTSSGKSSLRVKDAIATIKNLNLVAKTSGADGFTVAHNGGTVAEATLIGCTISSARHGVYLYKTQADVVVNLENTTVISGRDGASAGSAIYANNGKGIVYVKNGTTLDAQGVEGSYGVQLYTNSTATVILESGSVTKSKGCALYFNGNGAGGTIKVVGTAIVENSYTAYSTGDVTAHTLDFSESTRYQALLMTKRSGNRYSYNLYEDLATALSAAPQYSDGPITVTLIQNVTNFAGVTVAFPCTIDGNGYSVTMAEGKTAFTLGANCTSLELNNVSINGNILAGFNGQTVITNMKGIATLLNVQGYALHANEDTWTIVGVGVVSLNGWNYATIQEALTLIKAGESLNVLIDFSTDTTIVIDKDITIYGNGKSISSTASPAMQISNTFTANELKLYATGVGIKTSNGEVDPIVITLNGCTIGDATSPIGSHGIQFQYLDVDVTLFMTNSTVYAAGRAVHTDMNADRIVNITIKMDTLDTVNPTLCSTGNNGLTFHFANDVNVTLVNVYIKAKDVAFGASQHDHNNAANPKVVVANATNCKFESTTSQAVAMNFDRGNINSRFIADVTLTDCIISAVTHGVVLDGSTTEHGASKLTVTGGSITVSDGHGIRLRGDLLVNVSNTTVSAAAGWAIYTEQTGDTSYTTPYMELTLTNATLSGLGGVRFSSNKDATRGNSKLTISGGSITATGAYNATVGSTTGKDDSPSYMGILSSGAADVVLNSTTISAPSTTGIHFWQGCSSANLTLTNTTIGTVANPIGRLGIYVYQSGAEAVNITLTNSTVAAKNIAIKVNGKPAQTANITISNDTLDTTTPTLYSKDSFGISVNWAADLHVDLTNIYIKSKDSGIHGTQHESNSTSTNNPKVIGGTITGCLIDSENIGINAYTDMNDDVKKKPMYALELTIIDSTVKGKNSGIKFNVLENYTGSYLILKGNTRIEGNYGLLLYGVGGDITVTTVKVGDYAPAIVGTANAVHIDHTLDVTFTANGGSITATSGAAFYRANATDVTITLKLTGVTLSSGTTYAIDIGGYVFTKTLHAEVVLTNCTITGFQGFRVASDNGSDNESGYTVYVSGGSFDTTNTVVDLQGSTTALIKDMTSLSTAANSAEERAVYMRSSTGDVPHLTLDNTTLTYNKASGEAIYLANNGSTVLILQNNSKIKSNAHGILTGTVMYNNTITLINSSIEAAFTGIRSGTQARGTFDITITNSTITANHADGAIYFNSEEPDVNVSYTLTLNLYLNGATITNAAASSSAIRLWQGVLNIITDASSAQNKITATGEGSHGIYLHNYSYGGDIALYNTVIEAKGSGISTGSELADTVKLKLVNTSITAEGLHAIYFNSTNSTTGKLELYLDGATIKTTASVADDVDIKGITSSTLPHAIYVREGMLTITSPANSGKNVISAEGNRGIAIYLDQYCGVTDITLYNTEIKAHSDAFSLGSELIDVDSDTAKINPTQFKSTATVVLYNSSIVSTANRGILAVGSGVADITLNDTTVRAYKGAIELCNYGTPTVKLTVKFTNADLTGRTGANADIYSETYRALNFRSGAAYVLDLENVSVYGKAHAIYRTRPDGGDTTNVWFTGDFDNCRFESNTGWTVWAGGDNQDPTKPLSDGTAITWLIDLTFTDCAIVGPGGFAIGVRPNVKSSLTLIDSTVEGKSNIAITVTGYIGVTMTRTTVDGYTNKASNNTGAFRAHYEGTSADITLTDVTIRNHGVGSGSNYPAALFVSNGDNHLKAHNLQLYAEGTNGRGLFWHGKPAPTTHDNSVEITGNLTIRADQQGIYFNPKSGGTLKIHLDSAVGSKTSPDIKTTTGHGIHLPYHTTKSYDAVFTLDLKNVYVDAKDGGIYRSNDQSTLKGTIDGCKSVAGGTAYYLTNNGASDAKVIIQLTIKNSTGTGANGMTASGAAEMGSKITLQNVQLHGSSYGILAAAHMEFDITGSTITAGAANTKTTTEFAAFRSLSGDTSIVLNATNTTFEIYSDGWMTTWDSNGNEAGGVVASLTSSAAKAIYTSNGDIVATFDNCRIYAKGKYGVGFARAGDNGYGDASGANTVLTFKNGTVIEAEFTAVNFGEDYKNYDKKLEVTFDNATATVERGLVFRLNGTNANTRNATLNIKDSVLTTNGKALTDNDETTASEAGYSIRAIYMIDGNFTLNIQGTSTVTTTKSGTNAIYMGAGAGKIKFNMTGGLINSASEGIELAGGAGGIDFDMTGGRIVAAGAVGIRLRPGAGTNTVDIAMSALNTTTPDIDVSGAWGHGIYIHNDASITINLTNTYIRSTETVLCKTDPNKEGTAAPAKYFDLVLNATGSKLSVVGHTGDNSGYSVIQIADANAKKSPVISKLTFTDCELINSSARADGNAHGFRIDAAEGSYLKFYGGSIETKHTVFRFREWVDVTIDVSPNTGKGTKVTVGNYLFDTANNDNYTMPSGVTEMNCEQHIYIKGADISVNTSLAFNVWHSANRNINVMTIEMIDTTLYSKGNVFEIGFQNKFEGDLTITLTNCDITGGNGCFRLSHDTGTAINGNVTLNLTDTSINMTNNVGLMTQINGNVTITATRCEITANNGCGFKMASDQKDLTGNAIITMTDTTISATNTAILVTRLKGNSTVTLTNCALSSSTAEGLRIYGFTASASHTITLHNTTVSAGDTAINPDFAGPLVLRITFDKAYGETPNIVSTGTSTKTQNGKVVAGDHHGIHFQSGGAVEFYMENVYIYAPSTGIYRSSNDNVMNGVVKNSKIEGESCCMRICWDNTNARTVTWYSVNSAYVGETRLANNRVCSYTFEGCSFYNEDGNALMISVQGVVNLTDCTITSATAHGIFVDDGTAGNTDVVVNITNTVINAKRNGILVDPKLVLELNLTNVIATSGEATVYMNGGEGSTLTIVGGIFENHGTAGYIIDILGEVVANIYGGYYHTTNQGALRARDYTVMNVYGGYYEMSPNEYHSQWTAMIRLGTDSCAGRAIINVYGGTFEAPEDLYSVFCVNRGRGINLYAFNAIGARYILVKNNTAKIDMEYPTAVHEYFTNNPDMVDGAQVKLVLTDDNAGGIRFVSNIDAATIDYAKWLADDGNVTFGTVIAPLDYIQMLPAFTVELLNAAELPYLDIVAKDGLIQNADGSVTLRAVISEIQEHNYDRVFAAIAYAKVSVDGNDVYLYSIFDEEANSRSLKQLAERALADVIEFQTSTYRFAVGDGTYSRYTDEQRAAMSLIADCTYQEEIIIVPTETTPGLKKVWCDSCGTYYEVVIPAGTAVAVSNDD